MRDQDDVLVFEADLDAPPEKVWRAVATPEVREAWLGGPETGAAEVADAEPASGWTSYGRPARGKAASASRSAPARTEARA
jgi:uncharacterized protein YndB with AHSA1/START domain